MQDTFVDAFKNPSKFQNRSIFKTWIIRIMLNNCYWKKEKAAYKNEVATDVNEKATPLFTRPNNDTIQKVHSHELKRIFNISCRGILHITMAAKT